ncbi:MAG: hypothetical protein ACOYD4_03610 [Solirubrobacterales bacterium]
MPSSEDAERLRREVAELRAENEKLRGYFRIGPPDPGARAKDEQEGSNRIKVLLLPDPLREEEEKGPGPQAVASVAAVVLEAMRERGPDVEWRAEHDLARIPEDAECHQLGDVLRRVWDGTGRIPPTYRVVCKESSEPAIQRCLVQGEPESERFLEGHRQMIRDFDDLAAEGEAAIAAGESHHAGWVLKALDVVLARIELARVCFETDGDWMDALSAPRPEYLLPRGVRVEATAVPDSP